MRAEEVALQLARRYPLEDGSLTKNVEVRSLVRSGAVMTAETVDSHGLAAGQNVAIAGAVTPIAVAVLTRTGTTAFLETAAPHDLTEAIAGEVTISGAVEANFNGTFEVTGVPSRLRLTLAIADSGATVATGTIVVLGAASALNSYDGLYEVLDAPTPTSFRFSHPKTSLANPVGTIEARTKPRIAIGVSPERLVSMYTEQKQSEKWLFVVLGDVDPSKSRDVRSDAFDNQQRGNELRQQILQNFSLLLFAPATDELSGARARDDAEALFRPICRSVLGFNFESGLYVGNSQGRAQFTGHGFLSYDSAVYVHRYSFQQVVDLVFEDSVGPDLDVAFRDLEFALFPVLPVIPDGAGTETVSLDANVDLDEEPEP